MAKLIQASRRSILCAFKTLFSQRDMQFSTQPNIPIWNFLGQFSRNHATAALEKSPFESNVLRILRNEMEYQLEYAPPQEPVTKYNIFTVENRPGESWITLTSKLAGDECIKIEATMFDGSVLVPKTGDDATGEDVRLHVSLLVDILKGKGDELLEFVCSAWPDSLEIQKLYIFGRDGSLHRPYMGPNFRDLDKKLQDALYEFLKMKGVNDDLARFLHEYMMNKDRSEFIKWLENVKTFVEK